MTRGNKENEFNFKVSQHPPETPRRAQVSVTWLLREGPQSYQDTSPGHSRESLQRVVIWDWMRQVPVILASLLILPLAENCSRLKDRDAKCSLTLYFTSLLSLIRQTAFKFWLPIFRRLGHNLQNVPSQQNGPAGVMTLMPVIISTSLHYRD